MFWSGFRVYATCSAQIKGLVKSRGADEWFDYNSSGRFEQIKQIGASITLIVDCIGSEESSKFCSKVLSPNGGHYHSIKAPLPVAFKTLRPEDNVVATTALAYTLTGEEFVFPGMRYPADVAQGKFAGKCSRIAEDIFRGRKILPHPIVVRNGGLKAVLDGLKEIREAGPRGYKIVYSRD